MKQKRVDDRFREHLRDVERNDKDAFKPVAKHFNLPNHSKQHIAVCGLSIHLGSLDTKLWNKNLSSIRQYQRTLFIQLIYSCFLVTIFPPIA